MKIAFTICSANYLPYAKSMADSLVRHNPEYKFVIALADTYNQYDTDFFMPHQVIPVLEMHLPHYDEMNNRYTIFELSCALKPYISLYLFETYKDCHTLFYFDSDILVYSSLTRAEEILEQHSLLITPHIAEAKEYEDSIFTELNVLRSGIYNAGFFGVNRTTESFAFLNWWKKRMEHLCIKDVSRSLFDDQIWLNFAPLYFKSAFILFDPGYNLAYWNFLERKLSMQNGKYMVNEVYSLVFFHYSGYDIHLPEVISKHQKQFTFENSPEYLPLFENYRECVLTNKAEEFFALPATLGKPLLPVKAPIKRQNFWERSFQKIFQKARQ